VLVAATGVAVLWWVPVAADDPVSSNVRFNREIIRILQRRCLPCHAPGGISVPLTTYRDVRDWGRAIREEVVEQRMPPVAAPPGTGRFQDPLGLTARETTTLLAWIDGGMPRGNDRDLPATVDPFAEELAVAPGDLRVELPPQQVPAGEALVTRRVSVDLGLTADRLVTRIDVRPGARALLRGAFLYQGRDDASFLGGWTPWQHTVVAPAGRAFKLVKGVPLTVVLYYRGGRDATVERSAIELYFADEGRAPLAGVNLATGTNAQPGRTILAADTTLWAAHPRLAPSTESLEVRAERPDGSVEVLLWMPTARPDWPSALVLQEPVTLPAGSVLTLATSGRAQAGATDQVMFSAWWTSPRSR
jgi:hypothetical protein